MTIGIDASRSIETIQKTGVEKVSDELIKEIEKLRNKEIKGNEIKIIYYTPQEITWLPKENQRILKWPFKFLWTQIRLASELIFHPPQIMFFPVHNMPLLLIIYSVLSFPRKLESGNKIKKNWIPDRVGDDNKKTKYFKIIHDIAFKKQPQLYSWKQRLILNLDLWLSLKICTKIFVPSNSVRQDIITYCHSKNVVSSLPSGDAMHYRSSQETGANTHLASKIIVTHWGYKKMNDELSIMNYGKRKKQLSYIGRIEEKKNITNLIKAFEIFHDKYPDYKLILAGKIDKNLFTHYSLPVTHYINFLGYISEQKKHELLQESLALIHVPFEEGFGFPLLEAFDFGLPVVASDIPVLREVGAEACLYVNPNSQEDMAKGLENIVRNEKLQAQLITHGHEQLNNFTWQKTAEKILVEIDKLC